MKRLQQSLERLGWTFDPKFSSLLSGKKIHGIITEYLTITKSYEGYKVKYAEFLGDSIGRMRQFESKHIADILRSL